MSDTQTTTQKVKDMKNQAKMFHIKEQDKSPETDPNEMNVYYLPDRESKNIVFKMFTEGKRTMHEQSENFNTEIEDIKNYQTEVMELKNTIIELKNNSLEGFNIRLDQAEERISELWK